MPSYAQRSSQTGWPFHCYALAERELAPAVFSGETNMILEQSMPLLAGFATTAVAVILAVLCMSAIEAESQTAPGK
jgi:hypothetical protein